MALALVGYLPQALADAGEVLDRVAVIRSLSRDDAAKGLPVFLKGTVVYKARGGRAFILHDGEEALSVHLFRAKELGLWKGGRIRDEIYDVGAVIEIEGVTGPAGYSPVIIPIRFKRVGTAPLPEPKRIPMERLLSGSDVSQRVLVEGVVQRSVAVEDGKWAMSLMVDGHLCDVDFQMAEGFSTLKTVDSRVQVRGFCSPVFNLRSESTRLRLLAWGQDDVTVIEPPPADPFAARHLPLNGLLPFSRVPDRFHRKVTEGIVNFAIPGHFFFLQDGTNGLRVESSSAEVKVGDRLEVAGFVDTTSGIASLSEAVARRLGTAELPAPMLVTAEELLLPGMAGRVEPVVKVDHSGCVVQVRGLLRQIERRSREGIWSMLVESGGMLFRAQMPGLVVTYQPPWREGSEVVVTGVCELEFSPRKPGTNSPLVSGFNLWLRNPGDMAIVKGPPWWTPQLLGIALGGTGLVLALALVWSLLLHRKVDQQMGIISSKLRSETIHTERNRLAQDLHDTLEQQLVGVALQLDDAEEIIRKDPELATEVVTLARRMLRHTRMEARRSVWDLRSQVLESDGLVPALEALAESVASPSGPSVEVRTAGEPRSFPLETEFQLFRVAQEALANALKHARAKRIVIALQCNGETTRLTISDDGEGFSAVALNRSDGSHFGVLGMYERAERIGGKLTIARNSDGGCSVTLMLSHEPSPALQTRIS